MLEIICMNTQRHVLSTTSLKIFDLNFHVLQIGVIFFSFFLFKNHLDLKIGKSCLTRLPFSCNM